MTKASLFVLLWVIGFLGQAVLLLGPRITKSDIGNFILSLGFGLLGFIPGRNEDEYKFVIHVFLALVSFMLCFAILFRERILPRITEHALAFWVLITMYVVLVHFHAQAAVFWLTIALGVGAVIFILLPWQASIVWRGILYVLYLCMVTFVGGVQFKYQVLRSIFGETMLVLDSPITALTGGMAAMIIGANVYYLFLLIPLPAKNQTWKERMQALREHTGLMVKRFTHEQIHPMHTVLLLAAVASVMAWNLRLHFMDEFTLINILVLCSPYIAYICGATAHRLLNSSASAKK